MILNKSKWGKIKVWVEKLIEKQRVDILQVKSDTLNNIEKFKSTTEDFIDAEYEIDPLQKEVDSIKKVIKN